MLRKRSYIAIVLVMILLLSFVPNAYAAGGTDISNIQIKDGEAVVKLTEAFNGTINYIITQGASTVYIGKRLVDEKDEVTIPLPNSTLAKGSYSISFSARNEQGVTGKTKTVKANIGSSNTSGTGGGAMVADAFVENVGRVRCIMVPYTYVYSDSGLSNRIGNLKRLDLVTVISQSQTVAQIEATFTSGSISYSESAIASSYGDDDVGQNDTEVSFSTTSSMRGYISTSAFQVPTLSQMDMQREVVEVGYTRMGSKGVYSRAKRYIDVYVDCSSFVSWCYYQCGFTFGSVSSINCDGIGRWSDSQPGYIIIFDAGKDNSIAQSRIDAMVMNSGTYAAWLNYMSDPLHYPYVSPPSFSFSDDGQTQSGISWEKMKGLAMSYTKEITPADAAQFQMGDIILWNSKNAVTLNWGGSQRMCVDSHANGQGLDHTGMIVGVKDNIITIIEAVSPTVKITELPIYSGRVNPSEASAGSKIVRVLRPAYCTTPPAGVR